MRIVVHGGQLSERVGVTMAQASLCESAEGV